jgi:deazaflavin-dependent oxidoreductase (nitroreductase family)
MIAPMSRLKRLLFRAPVILYRLRVGWLLGRRFLLLEHTGRRSGVTRKAVLEVVDVIDDHPVIVSAFGTGSDWYLNVTIDPLVHVEWSTNRFTATTRRLDPEETRRVFERYQRNHPRAAAVIGNWLGISLGDDVSEAVEAMPVLVVEPTLKG